jgi:aspartate-semialdehyde dehydrogenase
MKKYNVAVVGATGLVGGAFVQILEERGFPIAHLKLLASERSTGITLKFRNQEAEVQTLRPESFEGIDFALFSAGAGVSKEFAPIAVKSRATVIDNSSAFRMHADVPLVVPEVNSHALDHHRKIIANPNCSTIQMVVAIKPLHDVATIKRIVVSTYQAVSGKGKDAVDALIADIQSYLNNQSSFNARQIAFNLCPHIDIFMDDGSTKEETKMVLETRKILEEPELPVTATCVRVPVVNGHSCSVNLEFEKPLAPEEAKDILSEAPGVIVMDKPDDEIYPTPLYVSGKDEVFVGRIRRDDSVRNGLNLWVVADNLKKGAALNAIQIAEKLINLPN